MMKLAIVALAAVFALLNASGTALAQTRLLTNCFWPPQHLMCTKVLPTWIEWVEEATEGRVSAIVPPKSLAAPPEQWNAVEAGVMDVAVMFSGFIGNRVQGSLVSHNLFTATNDNVAMTQALWETYQTYFPDEYEGVELLSMWTIPTTPIYSLTDDPVDQISDLVDRRVWTVPGNTADLLKAMGSGVVSGPAVQANELISRGVVDAFLGFSADGVVSAQLTPYVKSMTLTNAGLYGPSFSLFMNKDRWAEISEQDQEAIREVSGLKLGLMVAGEWDDARIAAEKEMADAGIRVIEASPEFEAALMEYAPSINQIWIDAAKAKGIDAEAALEFYTRRARELTEAGTAGQ
ncbi:type 2 periplasmic-binding domain-containing protein [Martelella soudanensis]|uniref:hypothetical protein n=1 Tax=unclassified Martelella TaxID=2629616 RepID=UPI0015DE6C74|nr:MULTISPECIES: hypothetical protein [unclassified Martelella]